MITHPRELSIYILLFFYQHLSFAFISPAKNHLGVGVILVPMVGGLIVGLMARYGSDRIRGHGIPEALEAILIGRSKMQPASFRCEQDTGKNLDTRSR